MLYTPDQYFQAFANGATYFMGCPERELFDAMVQVAKSGEGPADQTPSIGCSIKWKGGSW